MSTERLTVAQALVRFLAVQQVERDGRAPPLLRRLPRHFRARQRRRARPGAAAAPRPAPVPPGPQRAGDGPPRLRLRAPANRLRAFACTSSVGPAATNMVTGAALATINRLPVLLLPGDTFAGRAPHPVLQQLEAPHDGTITVNDCFRPVTRYFDRITRPEQLVDAALAALRVLTDPAETGAVCLALPEDVQTEVVEVRPPSSPSAPGPLPAAARPGGAGSRGCAGPRGAPPAPRGRRRRGLRRGDRGAARVRRRDGHPGRRDPGGARRAPSAHPSRSARSARPAPRRRTPGGGGGPGDRRRYPLERLHDGVEVGVPDPGVRFVNVNVAALDAAKHARSRSRRTRGSRSTRCAPSWRAGGRVRTGQPARP